MAGDEEVAGEDLWKTQEIVLSWLQKSHSGPGVAIRLCDQNSGFELGTAKKKRKKQKFTRG